MRLAASGSLVMAGAVIAIGVLEYVNPNDQFKPSYLVGTITGRLAAAEAKAAEAAKAAYVEGVKSGELRAQVAYDAQLAQIEVAKTNEINAYAARVAVWQQSAIQTLQADLDRSTAAWQAAYQLTQTATQGAIAMENDLMRIRATQIAQTQGMKSAAANVLDFVGMLGALGSDQNMAAVNGDAMRAQMAAEITRGGVRDAGAMAQTIMSRFPNPAQWRLEREGVLRQAFAVN